jgi:hypothetical protein
MRLRTVFQSLAPDAERYATYNESEYDGAPDAGAQMIGYGPTEADARADFMDLWLERESERDVKRAVQLAKVWDGFLDRLFSR